MTCYSFFSCGEFSWSEDRICCDWSKAILRVNIIGAYLNNKTQIEKSVNYQRFQSSFKYHYDLVNEKRTFLGWLRALLVSLQQRPLLTLQSLLVRQSSPEIGSIRIHSLINYYAYDKKYENNISNTYSNLYDTNTKKRFSWG